MKTQYTALYTCDPTGEYTKTKFTRVKDAENYIKDVSTLGKEFRRGNWLVVNTEVLSRHLDRLENQDINGKFLVERD